MIQVRSADDVAQYVRQCTLRGGALWGADFSLDTRAVRYPLVVYLHNPWKNGPLSEGVQAYGTVTRVTSGPKAVAPANLDLVPQHMRQEQHKTWFHFEQILNVNPSVPPSEFYTAARERVASVPSDQPIALGPPYPVKHQS